VLVALAGTSAAAAAPVPVEVCAESREWRRPGPDEMARTVWRDNRYADAATGRPLPHALDYYTHHFLFFTTPSPSGAAHVLDMSGLATAHPRELCHADGGPIGPPLYDLAAGRTVAVWALGYRVLAADLTADALTLTVEPNAAPNRGYAIVEVARPPAADWTARAVLADGREVARKADWWGICCAEEAAPDAPRRLPATGGPPLQFLGLLGAALAAAGLAARRP
jgi:hypothetical protein